MGQEARATIVKRTTLQIAALLRGLPDGKSLRAIYGSNRFNFLDCRAKIWHLRLRKASPPSLPKVQHHAFHKRRVVSSFDYRFLATVTFAWGHRLIFCSGSTSPQFFSVPLPFNAEGLVENHGYEHDFPLQPCGCENGQGMLGASQSPAIDF